MKIFRVLFVILTVLSLSASDPAESRQPNTILLMADDMGFSDIGIPGGEISTPNLDRLAVAEIRLTQFYNKNERCFPTRSSLLTGLYPHQTGLGYMVDSSRASSAGNYGEINRNCVTIAEVLSKIGYST